MQAKADVTAKADAGAKALLHASLS